MYKCRFGRRVNRPHWILRFLSSFVWILNIHRFIIYEYTRVVKFCRFTSIENEYKNIWLWFLRFTLFEFLFEINFDWKSINRNRIACLLIHWPISEWVSCRFRCQPDRYLPSDIRHYRVTKLAYCRWVKIQSLVCQPVIRKSINILTNCVFMGHFIQLTLRMCRLSVPPGNTCGLILSFLKGNKET